VGSRLAIVTFAYGSTFGGVDGAVAIALLLGLALAVVLALGLVLAAGGAGGLADAEGFAPSEAIVAGLDGGAETSASVRIDWRPAVVAGECVFLATAPAAAAPPAPTDEPKAPYEAAAAVPVGTTIAAVTTAAKAVGRVLGLRCAPMK
jgi:hypothetical protein